ncbi:spore coat protein [Jeotgalibacillus proteolyticus]|uniref:Spore coat protein n=1 Tax=Jeotgalibacillus proteolyticus TaxID=2082395 RepID=A0A2S5GD83_9BACL|nr:spore coat protein [Jeotgalibacillus proteolyticus]PPA70949.1 spore coat protein [Jeotgalibacillus proteolyticus]
MQNQSQNQPQSNMPHSENVSQPLNHGGHEMFDVQEVLSTSIGVLDQYTMYRQHAKDQSLVDIIDRQHAFIQEEYNVTLEVFRTGAKPSKSIVTYDMNMEKGNDTVFGLTQTPPKKPIQSVNEINDQSVSGYMLGLIKSGASLKAMTALEMTNPVLRRVVADSVPNWIEMAYEIFLYQNKRHYYQVPQLSQGDMQQILSSFAPAPGQAGTNGNMMQ